MLREKFCVDTGSDLEVDVLPLYEYQLKKFQVRFYVLIFILQIRNVSGPEAEGYIKLLLLLCGHGIVDIFRVPKSHRATGGNSGCYG